jgi:hypothetical protein
MKGKITMELLGLVKEMQSAEYAYKMRRQSLENLCGMNLTEYQIGVLMSECQDNSQTIYAAQQRNSGTSTALLLKVYQSIFLDNKLNNKYIISKGNNPSAYMKNQMMNLLGRANLLQEVRRDSRYRIEFNNGCVIHFENENPINLRGSSMGAEFFLDDYTITTEVKNQEMSSVIFPSLPIHVHYFLAGNELEQEWTQLLFN